MYAQREAKPGDSFFSVRWNGVCEAHFGFDQPRYGMTDGNTYEWAKREAFALALKMAKEGWTDVRVYVTETKLLSIVAERG